jgi:2OG-Fe(II) oxygenase superfamily
MQHHAGGRALIVGPGRALRISLRINRTVQTMPMSFVRHDVIDRLPPGWQHDIRQVAAEADFRDYPRTPLLSREAEDVSHIRRGRVRAHTVQERLPWLYKLYRSDFLELAVEARAETINPAFDDRYGVVLNVQRGKKMRFECHVDSNPVTGILFLTDHPSGGGELIVAHDPAAVGVETVEHDCSVIKPQTGQLIFFDGKTYPHYARALRSGSDMRVVAVMNFYTESFPESTRPQGLNRHLFGED